MECFASFHDFCRCLTRYPRKKLPNLYDLPGLFLKIRSIRSTSMDIFLTQPSQTAPTGRQDLTMTRAQELEAAFLAEMLSHAGLGDTEGPFAGGHGEAQFASFLRQEQARLMVQAGGIGLAEVIFNTMVAKGQGNGA
jgi:peptidoglycan hydrolase FlgJ